MKFSRLLTVTSMVLLIVLAFAAQAMAVADDDEDGVPNGVDECPLISAPGTVDGCPPDTDGDGVLDNIDDCPSVYAPGTVDGCPVVLPPLDSDFDGVPDISDLCPTVYGLGSDGCPIIFLPTDTDGDGTMDELDECPSVYGLGPDGCPVNAPPVVVVAETPSNDQTSTGQVFDLVKLLEFTVTDTEAQSMALIVAETNEDGEQVINIYDVNEDGTREVALTLTADYIAQFDIIPAVNATLWTNDTGEITLYHLTTGEFQINVGPDEQGNVYEIIFDTVPDYNPYRRQWNVYDVLNPVQSGQ